MADSKVNTNGNANTNSGNLKYGKICVKTTGKTTVMTYSNENIGINIMHIPGDNFHSCIIHLSSYFIMLEQVANYAIHNGNINSNLYDLIVKSAKEVHNIL